MNLTLRSGFANEKALRLKTQACFGVWFIWRISASFVSLMHDEYWFIPTQVGQSKLKTLPYSYAWKSLYFLC
jgi:hypothetical protein